MAHRADRAKIFAPFDALKGFHEALAAQEVMIVPKRDLSEEMKEELDYKLQHIEGHPVITVTYYSVADGNYLQITGKVGKISPSCRILQVVNTRIPFDNIQSIEGDCFEELIAD